MPKVKLPNLALRRLRAGFKPSRGQAIVAVVLALVACMAVVQVRVNRADDGYQNARREDLIAILDGLGQNTRRLESEITELEARKNSLASSADKAQTAREQAAQQVRVLGILAGTMPAQGPGVRITLNDPDGKMQSSNLLDAIEELRDAGRGGDPDQRIGPGGRQHRSDRRRPGRQGRRDEGQFAVRDRGDRRIAQPGRGGQLPRRSGQ